MPLRIICLIATLVFLLTPTNSLGEAFGEQMTLDEITPIATVLAAPDEWKGKLVRVEGTVTDVCPRKGCWMSLREGEAAIRIKVEDDVIRFPMEAKERQAAAEGMVEVMDLDRERYTSWMAHLAEEKGQAFDPSSIGEPPYRLVQIQGRGAEISE